ncbi:transcription antitermination protein NusB [Synechococcus sp. RSCCF101]|uniref:transcription antitermination factor NusB n=1 Tax=Synechococcus sp. RSCCF101 TaxID=2511069 RepID=UPI001249390B|nr:transcription antitermination factor NusB [Synechococcus sp. RSCCF101]QEY32576.1 transcription antitermination protein NusB [Synechococcus sp. RSCCF101]
MHERSLARELALLTLAQIPDRGPAPDAAAEIPSLLERALTGLREHLRETLDRAADDLERCQQQLGRETPDAEQARILLGDGLGRAEQVLNHLSGCLDLPRLLLLADQGSIRRQVEERVRLVLNQRESIDERLDAVMEGWRLKRLPRIDRDILRLASVDLELLRTPPAVACNEAVELAHRYSDDQGRRMINGVLRRLMEAPASRG